MQYIGWLTKLRYNCDGILKFQQKTGSDITDLRKGKESIA